MEPVRAADAVRSETTRTPRAVEVRRRGAEALLGQEARTAERDGVGPEEEDEVPALLRAGEDPSRVAREDPHAGIREGEAVSGGEPVAGEGEGARVGHDEVDALRGVSQEEAEHAPLDRPEREDAARRRGERGGEVGERLGRPGVGEARGIGAALVELERRAAAEGEVRVRRVADGDEGRARREGGEAEPLGRVVERPGGGGRDAEEGGAEEGSPPARQAGRGEEERGGEAREEGRRERREQRPDEEAGGGAGQERAEGLDHVEPREGRGGGEAPGAGGREGGEGGADEGARGEEGGGGEKENEAEAGQLSRRGSGEARRRRRATMPAPPAAARRARSAGRGEPRRAGRPGGMRSRGTEGDPEEPRREPGADRRLVPRGADEELAQEEDSRGRGREPGGGEGREEAWGRAGARRRPRRGVRPDRRRRPSRRPLQGLDGRERMSGAPSARSMSLSR